MNGIIYRYISPSEKCYVGQTTNEHIRTLKHKEDSIKSNYIFYRSIRKYGFNNFKYEILYSINYNDNPIAIKIILDAMEMAYITYFDSRKNGYNCTNGGEGILGFKFSDESKRKMSNSKIGDKNHFYGKTHTIETINKMSKSHSGLNHPLFGKQLSEACNQAMLEVCRIKFLQYDLSGNFIKEWESGCSAFRETGVDNSSITKCARGKLHSAGGFIWKYKPVGS